MEGGAAGLAAGGRRSNRLQSGAGREDFDNAFRQRETSMMCDRPRVLRIAPAHVVIEAQ
jgi:hypothetical protein